MIHPSKASMAEPSPGSKGKSGPISGIGLNMDGEPADPIRKARVLSASARQEKDPSRLIHYAAELRQLERPDLALAILDSLVQRAGSTPECLAERTRCLKALGCQANESSATSTRRSVLETLQVFLAQAIVAVSVSLVRLLTGKRHIYFSSMGKFTRLADLVDRVDPLLRRLAAKGESSSYKLFVFFFGGYPNRQLFDMYGRHCTFVPATNRLIRKLASYFIAILELAGRFTEITTDYRRINQDFLKNPPVISFSEVETKQLRKQMECAGIDPEKPLICFGLRDMAYYEFYGDVMKIPLSQQGKRASTHHRCPPLDTYVRFALFWAQRGCQVVRMGLRVSEALPKNLHPLIIDYTCENRSDELDAFLFAQCWFLTAGDTGLFSGAAAFDRPALVSDLFLIRNTIYSSNKQVRNIFVPKLIRDVREGRYLSFREQIYFNSFFSYHDECEAAGFEIVHNSPDDVIDASLELAGRLEGTYETSQEDAELQQAFHSLYPPGYYGYQSTGMVSAKFLKKYSHLLD